MKPSKSAVEERQGHLFQTEIMRLINPEHSLVKLAASVDWKAMEEVFGAFFCESKGRPGIPTRLMVALHYLKYTYDLSDESVINGWLENPYWQHLSGMKWFEHELPINSSTMSRWRRRMGERGAETLLLETVKAGLRIKAIKACQLKKVNIDTPVLKI